MNKKGAIGLSMNAIVIIIISLIILGSGITLLYKFIGGAEDIQSGLDSRTSEQLERLLVDQGKTVALPLNTKPVLRGDSHVFGLGMLNIEATNNQFSIDVALRQVLDERDNDIKDAAMAKGDPLDWVLWNSDEIIIEENQHHKEPILVNIPENALVGTYVFAARVIKGDGTPYGNAQRFIVVAK